VTSSLRRTTLRFGRIVAPILALAIVASCARPRADEEWAHASAVTIPVVVEDSTTEGLSPRAVCYVNALREAGDPGANCMAGCIRQRAGVNIGGGCWHLCYAYQRPMPDSSIYANCPKQVIKRGPPPAASCRAGEPTIRGTIVDATSEKPVPLVGVRLFVAGTDPFDLSAHEPEFLILAGLDGRFSEPVRPGLYGVVVARMGYRPAIADTLDLRESSCEVSVSLEPVDPAEEEGF